MIRAAAFSNSERLAWPLFAVFSLICSALFVALGASIIAAGELFHRLGFDWTGFYAQAMALRTGAGARMYDLAELNVHMQQLATWYSGRAQFQTAQPVPYPPWFGAAFIPFTLLPPPVAFGAWEAASVGTVLFLKPQYGLLFGLLILWKRRWHALAGVCAGGLLLLALGLTVAGPAAFLAMPAATSEFWSLRGPIGGPLMMINWRAVILAADLPLLDRQMLALVWVASLTTMAVCLGFFKGPWQPDSPAFSSRFCLLTLGALISSYDTHLHGAALLIVPLAAAWAAIDLQLPTRIVIAVALYLPTLILLWTSVVDRQLAISADTNVILWYVWPFALPAQLLVLAYVSMTIDLGAANA